MSTTPTTDPETWTYAERRAAGYYEQIAAERAAELAARAVTPAAAPDPREHVPLGSDVELADYIDEVGAGGGGGTPAAAPVAGGQVYADGSLHHGNGISTVIRTATGQYLVIWDDGSTDKFTIVSILNHNAGGPPPVLFAFAQSDDGGNTAVYVVDGTGTYTDHAFNVATFPVVA